MKKFTLVEILVSIAIIAILLGMAVGATSYVRTKIARTSTQTTMKLIEMAFSKYKNHFGMYPYAWETNPQELSLMDVTLSGASDDVLKATLWGFFNDVSQGKIRGVSLIFENGRFYIVDGWKNKILYVCPGVFNTESFDLISKGGDGSFDNASSSTRSDISNWNMNSIADDITNFTKH